MTMLRYIAWRSAALRVRFCFQCCRQLLEFYIHSVKHMNQTVHCIAKPSVRYTECLVAPALLVIGDGRVRAPSPQRAISPRKGSAAATPLPTVAPALGNRQAYVSRPPTCSAYSHPAPPVQPNPSSFCPPDDRAAQHCFARRLPAGRLLRSIKSTKPSRRRSTRANSRGILGRDHTHTPTHRFVFPFPFTAARTRPRGLFSGAQPHAPNLCPHGRLKATGRRRRRRRRKDII